jgi:hypothetical protein
MSSSSHELLKNKPCFPEQTMAAGDPVFIEELSAEQEGLQQALEVRALGDINPNVAHAPEAAGSNSSQVC